MGFRFFCKAIRSSPQNHAWRLGQPRGPRSVFAKLASTSASSSSIPTAIEKFVLKPLYTRPTYPSGVFKNLSSTIPDEELVLEHRFKTIGSQDFLVGKGTFSSYVIDGRLCSIKRGYQQAEGGKERQQKAELSATEEIEKLSAHDALCFADVWYGKPAQRGDLEKCKRYWTYIAMQHAYFAHEVMAGQYIQNTGKIMVEFLGADSKKNLIKILRSLGYKPGYFYDAKVLTEVVSSRIGTGIYPIATQAKGDLIPWLSNLCLASNLEWDIFPHPSTHLVTAGMVLFPRL